MTTLSTHVLDTTHGCPATGVGLVLEKGGAVLLESLTDGDGRCPALRALALDPGTYRLSFAIAVYFRARGAELTDPPFLDRIAIDFGIAGEGHYHVPLLVSPFGYSTYRGS